jgi:hypothetical protein
MPRLLASGPFTSTVAHARTEWQERARWPDWDWRRGLVAFALATASVMGVLALLFVALDAALCGAFDRVCAGSEMREHRAAAVAALLTTLAGPSMVAVLRRRPVWVAVPAVVLVFVGPWVVIAVA